MVADSTHLRQKVLPAVRIESVYVEIGYPRHIVSRERNLHRNGSRRLDFRVGRGHGGVVLGRPRKDGLELTAHRVYRGVLESPPLAERDEVTPEDVGYLDGYQGDMVLFLQCPEVV